MDRRPTWTDSDEPGDYVVPNVLSPRDLVFRPDNMDETVPHVLINTLKAKRKNMCVSCYISKKIRVGRSLLIFFFFF